MSWNQSRHGSGDLPDPWRTKMTTHTHTHTKKKLRMTMKNHPFWFDRKCIDSNGGSSIAIVVFKGANKKVVDREEISLKNVPESMGTGVFVTLR